jgi:hypothetical protein
MRRPSGGMEICKRTELYSITHHMIESGGMTLVPLIVHRLRSVASMAVSECQLTLRLVVQLQAQRLTAIAAR